MHLAQEGCRSLIGERRGNCLPFDTMKHSTLTLLPILVVAAACGGSGSAESGKNTTPDDRFVALPSDAEILIKAYDSDYHVPDGFFVDERATTTRSYTVHHVLDASASFELCSNDLVEAQAWEAADNAARAVNGYYVTSYENERYFEFVRELAYTQDVGNIAEPTSPGYARVFKCSHTSRDGVDRSLLDGYAGRIPTERLDAASLRDFTEYLWQFTFFNVSHKKVIDSYASHASAGLQHTLLLAFVVNQGVDACDRIDVIDWRYTADPASGDVERRFDTVHSFGARLVDGTPTLCQ